MDASIVGDSFFGVPLQTSLRLPPPPRPFGTVCVFCGASSGADPRFVSAAAELGRTIALEGLRLVYGGGASGLMDAVARGAAEHGGPVTAVTPHFLAHRIPQLSVPHEIVAVPDMHTRKKIMFERSDAFIALPGGIGTIEELTEVVTLHKLDQDRKPVVIANFGGFWDPLLELFAHLERTGFMHAEALGRCLVAQTPRAILPAIRAALDETAVPPVHAPREDTPALARLASLPDKQSGCEKVGTGFSRRIPRQQRARASDSIPSNRIPL
ncbi:TIGR00730 family Rossman fold protein [Devosia nitrariae]|uniref:Cytokinin riboside 5'-monophosphate phosphoribohydrolase n=1 Tax=Devosia nitrariae TaxID=2071872 RepID=A0ABQ5W660_9HYPH|nr:TIGR00730 family Rossman fold protein [Devosia nitrariae]GLQ55105.1 cytokinin riboside 5'-monophosphate phosphoribohydrolase [Devosia nitrariae]